MIRSLVIVLTTTACSSTKLESYPSDDLKEMLHEVGCYNDFDGCNSLAFRTCSRQKDQKTQVQVLKKGCSELATGRWGRWFINASFWDPPEDRGFRVDRGCNIQFRCVAADAAPPPAAKP